MKKDKSKIIKYRRLKRKAKRLKRRRAIFRFFLTKLVLNYLLIINCFNIAIVKITLIVETFLLLYGTDETRTRNFRRDRAVL